MPKDFSDIDRPYDELMTRGTDAVEGDFVGQKTMGGMTGTEGSAGAVETQPVKESGSLSDLWIETFIKSNNWQPKTQGFYIDGATGYAEFSNIYLSGGITATVGEIGGWVIAEDEIWSGNVHINSAGEFISMGGATGSMDGIGIFMGKEGSDYKFRAGDPNTSFMLWDGFNLNLNAPILGSLASGSMLSVQGWQFNTTWAAVDHNTVSWTAAALEFPNGDDFAIEAGDTGNITGLVYIFFDKNVSETQLQVSSTAANAVGTNRVLIGTASSNSNPAKKAIFQAFGGSGGMNPSVGNGNLETGAVGTGEIQDGAVSSIKANIASQGWTQTTVFTADGDDTVDWASGTFTAASGVDYAISAGTTGAMTGRTYIYLDTNVSTLAYQVSSTATDAVGDGKVLIAVAQNNPTEATFQVFGGNGGIRVDGDDIVANSITANEIAAGTITATEIAAGSITANEIAANTITAAQIAAHTITADEIAAATITATEIAAHTITADQIAANTITANEIAANSITANEMNVAQLSAITADMGNLTAGTITLPSGGHVKSGQTAYDTGVGFWLGNDAGTPKFSIGNAAGNKLTWNGSILGITGEITGSTITGGVIRTASGSTRIEMSGSSNSFDAYLSGVLRTRLQSGGLTFFGPTGATGGSISGGASSLMLGGANSVVITGSAGGSEVSFWDTSVQPFPNAYIDFGTSSRRWRDIYADGGVFAEGLYTDNSYFNDDMLVSGYVYSSLSPGTSAVYSLGASSRRWAQLHVNSITLNGVTQTSWPSSSGANTSLSNLGSTSINNNLIPQSNMYLGNSGSRWSRLYVDGGIYNHQGMVFDMGQNGGIRFGSSSIQIFNPFNSLAADIGSTSRRWGTVYADTFDNGSDMRVKKDIIDLSYGLDEIMQLRPVSFYFDQDKLPTMRDEDAQRERIGFLAQEVYEVIPHAASVGDDTPGSASIRPTDLIPVLVKAVQELAVRVEELESQ